MQAEFMYNVQVISVSQHCIAENSSTIIPQIHCLNLKDKRTTEREYIMFPITLQWCVTRGVIISKIIISATPFMNI